MVIKVSPPYLCGPVSFITLCDNLVQSKFSLKMVAAFDCTLRWSPSPPDLETALLSPQCDITVGF